MLGKQPLTREKLLEMLDRPENTELRESLESKPMYKEAVILIVLEADKHFNSADEFMAGIETCKMKNRSLNALAGSEAIT